MGKIVIYEPQCKGIEHQIFNSMILEMAIDCFQKKEIVLLSEKKHLEIMDYHITKKEVPIILFQENKIRNLINEFKNLMILKNNKDIDLIIFLSSNQIVMILAKIFLRKNNKIFIWHSILEIIAIDLKFRFWNYHYWLKVALKLNDRHTANLVLGESIKSNLMGVIPEIENQVFSIDHPYIFKKNISIKGAFDKVIKFGTIGYGSLSKGTNKIFDLDLKLKDIKDIELHVIGRLDNKEIRIPSNIRVLVHCTSGVLAKSKYNELIKELDYALYFYPRESYRFFASGAIFDAISNLKPIIAIKNDYFEYIFKKFGNIGYLFNDYNEMVKKIREITENRNIEEYRIQQQNMLKGQNVFCKEEVQKEFNNICKYIIKKE